MSANGERRGGQSKLNGRRARCEVYEEELSDDLRAERRLLWKELVALGVVLAVIILHGVL